VKQRKADNRRVIAADKMADDDPLGQQGAQQSDKRLAGCPIQSASEVP
jgi:hypothetical protein